MTTPTPKSKQEPDISRRFHWATGITTVLATAGMLAATAVIRPPASPLEKANRSHSVFTDLGHMERSASRGPFQPLTDPRDQDPALVALGNRLFHDAGLSRDGTVSCASCHELGAGGDDGRPTSIGIDGAVGERNAPTVWNSRYNTHQFWDGRAFSLEEQVGGPIEHPAEMGSDWASVIAYVRSDARYRSAFQEALGTEPSEHGVRTAIAAFERSLVTPESPFDRFLMGDEQALDAAAHRGYATFQRLGCITCHQGVNVGGNMLQPLGRMRDYFEDETDGPMIFKVPSLRNVAHTAPYLHDGSVATLEAAVRLMGTYQLGITIEDEDVQDIVAFLEALSGTLPKPSVED